MATYLVTGGCGFIGAHLTEKLINLNHRVIVVDDLSNGNKIHPQAVFKKTDLTSFDELTDLLADCDGCFHLAAIPTVAVEIDQWLAINQVNLIASFKILKAAVTMGNIPVVYASSCGVYGDSCNLPLKEESFIHPLSFYGCDKLSVELNAYALAHTNQLPSMGLRIFNVYGPGQHSQSPYAGVITQFITNLLEDKPAVIYGDGEQTRDFIFVEDVVDCLIHAINILKQNAHVSNICTGKAITINVLLDKIATLLGKPYKKQYMDTRVFDVRHSCGDTQRMNQYGFVCQHSLEEGLKKTLHHFLKSTKKK
ncbi:NAD-dependent epimerase/dehydratase family protein [Legionella yabuuchiae]|uniref:NAD-dependent epimerase/dehydratase family protein n=1 Tax=Legionella yabuuchiae TaxID=376727 RepID=UPI0010541399|nr:NAD-dependent epimerase/dehydratase family protein [Legionella yabuuchiae]